MQLNAYVFFDGRCEEALRFYTEHLGANVQFKMHYKDAPPDAGRTVDAKFDNQVMHASVRIGESILMMSDDCMNANVTHQGFRLSLTADTLADAERIFKALSEGGEVHMPLQATFWSKGFGMVTDQFGIGWMVTIPDGA
ncbi:VOC family protein [Paraburkholderia sp. DHOC27]|uniref:VOC family protein n=1 Tax=Paraburkholderia sp. DHOC27 TaxID=2303330 RepID=UPI000E3D6198|nr:VOC family protein [Paraburkholderia sp. DHOC27]RFU46269.1 VOC family protein [Paraburkholderia sp. DHOC27]